MSDIPFQAFIFGAGFSGRAYGRLVAEKDLPVDGTTRSEEKAGALLEDGITPHVFDGQLTPEIDTVLMATTHLVISIAPEEGGDPVLSALGRHLSVLPRLEWIAYLSTVGVYGNHDGGWVDEEAECRPVSKRSIQRIEAENAWREAARIAEKPLAILRLSGIYGPGRNALTNLAEGRARRLIKPGQVFNRIHVDDIARALVFLGDSRKGGVFNITDDEPAPPQDVVEYAASLMKVDPPPELDFETATLSPMARSFYGENKRVSNARVKQAGFTFTHSDFRRGLDRMWADGSWRKLSG
ncbi:SDR family oxidoreductase [Oricola cellulosilytica]|uniref:SDR family oxidoreductase n=1 Tax=Oricola cellulosilytica TaxID=1429082 RepID=A0A4R0PE90_9HYPH|nr:SDR family oxidoreductase [Oricola cellulosilytica]TCD16107.1 SDR family oxidoreductase [Oricola cellulosilytica]